MPPEKCAYALARYSRSPDSIRRIHRVGTHARFAEISRKLLLSIRPRFHRRPGPCGAVLRRHFGTGRDRNRRRTALGWAGASSRYQDFSKSGFIMPPEFSPSRPRLSRNRPRNLLEGYKQIHASMSEHLADGCRGPRDEAGGVSAQHRGPGLRRGALSALLRDPDRRRTGHQHSYTGAADPAAQGSEYQEVRELAEEIAAACAADPDCHWDRTQRENLWRPRWPVTWSRIVHARQSRARPEAVGGAKSAAMAHATTDGRSVSTRRHPRRYCRHSALSR